MDAPRGTPPGRARAPPPGWIGDSGSGRGSGPDGSWRYGWEWASGPGGSWGYGHSSEQSPGGTAFGFGYGSGGGGGGDWGGGANPSPGGTAAALRHDPGLSREWTPEEQAILDELLVKYASDAPVIRYAKIAMKLPEKTVRDVALRCRWMNKKESGKRKKEDHSSSKKSKDKKEKVADSSSKPPVHIAGRPSVPPYSLPALPIDDDEISSKAIGGPTGELLETNAQVLSQISTNLGTMQIQDNISLLCQTRDNILRVLKEMNDAPEIMKQMPPLPVKINEELVNSILPRPTVPMQ